MNAKPSSLTKDGVLTVPLYHATSDFFAALIMKSGLGARNVIAEWRVVDLAQQLVPLLDALSIGQTHDDPNFAAVHLLRAACAQTVTAGGFNFRHGGVYLSAARSDALRYAHGSKKGSEVLTTIHDALALVPATHRDAKSELLASYPQARIALEAKHRPVIIAARNVPIAALRGETGEEAEAALKDAEALAAKISISLLHDAVLQCCRFELLKPLPPETLSIEEIKPAG